MTIKKPFLILLTVISFLSLIRPAYPSDEEFLTKLEYDTLHYFAGESNTANGLIKDSSRPGAPCSVAVVGFGLTALCIGDSRGWIEKGQAYERVVKILTTFRDTIPNEHGFFYHFLDMRTGSRAWNSELSSIDTALFLAGALFAGEYFKGTEAETLAKEIYDRVDWQWMMNGRKIMCMGWRPEYGFLPYYWDSYSEAMILYALAIGSETHPIPAESWYEWSRPEGEYAGHRLIYCYTGSIFTYQYSQAFIDFRGLYEDVSGINYYTNSVSAVQANREFCIEGSAQYETYGENSWGLTACIGPKGYKGYGAKPGEAMNDGTIAPSGMAGSIVFDWEKSLAGLKYLYDNHKSFLYGKYGFKDAFNLDLNWWSEEYLGIDQGITVIMLENYMTGLVWEKFMQTGPIKKWMGLCFR
ncbi:MAG: glucoamylase family protein [Candidatus Omnitrophica bacterium]|nr:glucoamylase family protein [Candidatus Omnitrophota bacterium]